MSLSAAELAVYRDTSQNARLYCVVINPSSAWTGQVNDPAGTLATGARSITFDGGVLNPAGAAWQPAGDYTLLVGTAAGGRDLGVLRYKSGAAGGAGTLVVDKNNIAWSDNSYLTVLQEIRPWAKTPDVTGTYEDETEVYTTQNSFMHPLTLMGPPAVAFLDDANVDVDWWSDIETVHITGGAAGATTWTFNDGVNVGGAGTEANPYQIRYTAAGFHLVTCQKDWTYAGPTTASHTRYGYSVILERSGVNAPYMNVEANVSTELTSHGGRASITVFDDDADIAKFTSGSMVILFTETWYGGTQVDYGGNWTHRENIRFVGWLSADSVKQDPVSGSVTFEATTPAGIPITCWPANLHYDGDAEWHRIPSMATGYGCAKAMFHIISEHSTISKISDVHLPDNDKSLNWVDVSEADLWNQLEVQVGESIGAVLAFDLQGALYIEQDIQILPVGQRAAIDIMFTAADTDWFSFDLGTEGAYEKTAQNDFVSFTYDGADPEPWYSLAPGRQYSYGSIARGRGVRADTQAEANILAGLYLARANALFQNNRMAMGGDWFAFDVVPQRYFRFPLDGTETERGLVWPVGENASKMIPRGVQLNWLEGGFFDVELTFAQYAAGPAGDTGEYPDVTPSPQPQPPHIPPPWIPDVGYGHGEVWVFGTVSDGVAGNGGVFYTLNFVSGNPPTFTPLNTGLGDKTHIRWGPVGDTSRSDTHLACIDETAEVYVNKNNVDVDGVVANYTVYFLYSKDWGDTWIAFGPPTGYAYTPVGDHHDPSDRFHIDYKNPAGGPDESLGSLVFYENQGTSGAANMVFAARCGSGAFGRSNIVSGGYDGWGNLAFGACPPYPNAGDPANIGGRVGTPDRYGPGAMCMVTATGTEDDRPHFSRWAEHECLPATACILYGRAGGAVNDCLHVFPMGTADQDNYDACLPDMMASAFPTTAVLWWSLNIDTTSLETYVMKYTAVGSGGPVLQATLNKPCMGVWVYRILVDDGYGNKECILVAGRGYTAATAVSGATDTDLLYLSVNSGDDWLEKGESLYDNYGVLGIVGAFSDHSGD